MVNPLIALVITFILSVLLCPAVIYLVKKHKARQVILHYVDNHKSKSGTPTMGGIAFILAIAAGAACMFRGESHLALIAVAVMLGYGVVGFLNDFLKISRKQNLGLKAYQKILTQLFIAVIIAVFVYNSVFPGSEIYLPFSAKTVDLKGWIIPFVIFIFLASTNCVNLTDGLDGLASGVTLVYMLGIAVIMMLLHHDMSEAGTDLVTLSEYANLITLCGACIGGLAGFLCFNTYPAQVFMGDVGSLALGGIVGCVAVFSRLSLLLPVLGVMFVVSGVSVILQVFYFKATKGKRIFLMAPLHHHFERKGIFEGKIVFFYVLITFLAAALSAVVYIAVL